MGKDKNFSGQPIFTLPELRGAYFKNKINTALNTLFMSPNNYNSGLPDNNDKNYTLGD